MEGIFEREWRKERCLYCCLLHLQASNRARPRDVLDTDLVSGQVNRTTYGRYRHSTAFETASHCLLCQE